MIDEGDSEGHTSAHTQLSKPDQLHFIRNLRPIAAGSLRRKKKLSMSDSEPACVSADPLQVTGSSFKEKPPTQNRIIKWLIAGCQMLLEI